MFGNKRTLKSTLETVNQFIAELKEGVEENKTENEALQSQIDRIQEEKSTNDDQIAQAEKLIEKLS